MQTFKQIQWYPGHMFKSFREIKQKLKLVDLVCVLLDARLPDSSMNPEILKTVKDKPILLIFNKIDMADEKILNWWVKHYQTLGFETLKVNAQSGQYTHQIFDKAKYILRERIARDEAKGLKMRPIRTMILGIPNVGKSTLINQLTKTKSTKTGNTPGVTKSQQWVKLAENFELLDTPGVLWPKFEDAKVGYHLAITGAIKDKILPEDDVCQYAIKFLQTHYLSRLQKRYDESITSEMEYVDILDLIGKKRGALIKGNEIDYDRVYQIILTDIRNKQLGGLSFDRNDV